MEFRGQEEPAEGMGASSAPPPPLAPAPAPAPAPGNHAALPEAAVRYHECLRNHAAALGGHVVDGCGEFMPSAGAGDDALKCAACGCHRSFHRKDDGLRRQLLLPPPVAPPPPVTPTAPRVPLLLPPPHPYAAATTHPHHPPPPFPYHGTPSGSGGTTTESSSEERGPPSAHAAAAQGHLRRKRFRTKFTPEQKEQMLAFAERLGWRMQKQDEALVQQFCEQVGVRRQVFKVWMHNNKHSGSGSRRQPQLPPQEQQSQQQPQPEQEQQ
jgi:ZF-HD class homeobox domain-containing protein